MSEENHMGWKLLRGVRRDVVNFFQRFGAVDSVRFEDFSKVWKEVNFSLIYSNRVLFIELLEFTEELLQIVKEHLSSVYEFHTRVAALYTLYGLYFKQPIRGAAKIRFTKSEWEEVYSFIEKSREAHHYDVAFIFLKLYLSGAFTFSATIRPAGLEHGYRKYSEKKTTSSKSIDSELLYRPLISQKLVNSLVKLESLYCRKKSQLLGNKNLVFIDGQFAESLKDELKQYEDSTLNQCKDKISEPNSKSVNETQDTSQDTIARNSKSRKKPSSSQNETDNDDEEGAPKRIKPKSLLQLMAKKKAEYYIQKIQTGNNKKDSTNESQQVRNLLPLDEEDAEEEEKEEGKS